MTAIIIISALVVVDQITKSLAYNYLREIGTIAITSFFSLTYVENRGAAFGMLYGARWFLIIISVVILGILFKFYKSLGSNKGDKYVKVSIVLIAGGALGNFVDRLFSGFVIDFFHVTAVRFPVFNIADVLIVCGGIMFWVFVTFFSEEETPKEETNKEAKEEA
ncbi:MAG: signal peptidase II [Defluviitaleaceae bacterium]|nr:signal peptidase II [Defluviitaleaceae bacterium]